MREEERASTNRTNGKFPTKKESGRQQREKTSVDVWPLTEGETLNDCQKMLWGGIKDGGLLSGRHQINRNDSLASMDISSLSSDSHSSNESFNYPHLRRSSQLSDIFPYLDEETQDAVFFQDEDESTFTTPVLLAQKLEKEVRQLFSEGLVLVGLLETMTKVASQLLELSETEPYGVKGARVVLKLKQSTGEEEKLGSFALDPTTVSTFEIVLVLEQTQQLGTSIRSWLGQMTSGIKSIRIGSRYSMQKIDLYRSSNAVTFSL